MALEGGYEPINPTRYLCVKMKCAAPKNLQDEMCTKENKKKVHNFESHKNEEPYKPQTRFKCIYQNHDIGENTGKNHNFEKHENYESYIPHARFKCTNKNHDLEDFMESQECHYDMPCKASCFKAPPCMRASGRYVQTPVYPGNMKIRGKVQCMHNYPIK